MLGASSQDVGDKSRVETQVTCFKCRSPLGCAAWPRASTGPSSRDAHTAAAAARADPTPTRQRAQSGYGISPRFFGSSMGTPNCALEAESQPPTLSPRAPPY